MSYQLGVDLGTTFTAAAVASASVPEMVGLGNRALQIPSVLFDLGEGNFLVGEAAERRGLTDPTRLVREFKRRIGDPVPVLVSGVPYSPESLSSRLLRWVIDSVTERMGERPASITLTHPANWGPFRLHLMDQIMALADLEQGRLCSEPEAAAWQYAAQSRVAVGDKIAVYDLGGGTFDACVLEKGGSGFQVLGTPDGIEHLGGVDFDVALTQRVIGSLKDRFGPLDPDEPGMATGLSRLRRDCVEAKEALSTDADTVMAVSLPGVSTTVRLTRSELESMLRPALLDTVAAMQRALRSAGVKASDLRAVILVGGSSRIPLVAEMLQKEFGIPIGLDTHPKHAVALGAARFTWSARNHISRLDPPSATGAEETESPLRSPRGDASTTSTVGSVTVDPPSTGSTDKVPAAEPADLQPQTGNRIYAPSEANSLQGVTRGNIGALSSRRRQMLGLIAVLLVIAGVVSAVLYLPRRATSGVNTPNAEPTFSRSEASSVEATSTASDGSTTSPSSTSSGIFVDLPKSDALSNEQIVIPRSTRGTSTQLYLADVRNPGDLRSLRTPANASSWAAGLAPDRRTIVYLDGSSGVLRTMAADGSNNRALFKKRPRGCATILHASWSPTDLSTLVISCRTNDGANALMVVRIDGTVIRVLDTRASRADDPAVSPDGTLVAYWAGDKNGADGGALFTIAIDGTRPPTQLTRSGPGVDADPAWSPNGQSVAFRRRVGVGSSSNFDVLVIDADGKTVRTLMGGAADDEKPAWSPDGDRLAVVSNRDREGRAGGTVDLWVVSSEGGEPVPLRLDAAHIATPTWAYH